MRRRSDCLQNVGKLLSEDNINRATSPSSRPPVEPPTHNGRGRQKRFYERRGWPALESLELLPRMSPRG